MSLWCRLFGHYWRYTPYFRKWRCFNCDAEKYPK